MDTPTQISSLVLPNLPSLAENVSEVSYQTSSCKKKVIFQHDSPLLDVHLLSPLLWVRQVDLSHSVIEQNTSFCSTETPLVMKTTQCSQQMSSIVMCPSVTDVSAISVLDGLVEIVTINWSPCRCHVFSIKWVNIVTHRVVTCLLVLSRKAILRSKHRFSGTAVMTTKVKSK